MKSLKISKKILSVISIIISLLVIFTCVVFAASSTSNIYTNETQKFTGTISAKRVKYSGHNNASSQRALYFYTEFMNSNGSWTKSDSLLISEGNGFTNFNDTQSTFANPVIWRLEMNPYGVATKGCNGSGTIASR